MRHVAAPDPTEEHLWTSWRSSAHSISPGCRAAWTRLLRRWLAVGLLLTGTLLVAHPGSARGAPTTPTVVAARDLPSGATLRAADVRLADFPGETRPSGALSTLDVAAGRLLSGAVRAGEPLTDVRLAITIPASGDPATATVPVRLADAAVAELLRPGQRVDVVAAPGGSASVLASGATVVTISSPEGQARRVRSPDRPRDRLCCFGFRKKSRRGWRRFHWTVR